MEGFWANISSALRGVKLYIFHFFHRGICNQMFWKVKNFEFKKTKVGGGAAVRWIA